MKKIEMYINKKWFKIGIATFILVLIMPIYFKHENLEIYESITSALENWDKEFLIIAAIKLVFLNTLRCFPLYISLFMIINSININYKENRACNEILKYLFSIIFLPVAYIIIKRIYNIDLAMGKSSLIGLLWLFYYSHNDLENINIVKKSIGLLLFVMGIQWLDITTYFEFLGVGELTKDLLKTAEFMEAQSLINFLGILFFIILTSFSFLLLSIFKDQEKGRIIFEKELENRYLKEIQYLVHDLKTPLFSIRTLVEILKMSEENERKLLYFEKIENSLDKSDVMISEILKNSAKHPIKISELFNFVFSCLSGDRIKVSEYENNLFQDYSIYANKILFSRAIVNLIVNGYEASQNKIKLKLREYGKFFLIIIEDEGHGISDENMKKIFNDGFSTKNSSGLGLSFVKSVIEDHKFEIYIKKRNERGTVAFIKVPIS